MGNPGPEWRIWANINIFPIFYSIFMKIGQEALFAFKTTWNHQNWDMSPMTGAL